MRPIIIYLDTQDYINLFRVPLDNKYHSILADLKKHQENGQIKIGYSIATIMEFITKPNAENRNERVRRGELLRDICGCNSFPNFPELRHGAKFPNGGNWLLREGEKLISAKSFRKYLLKRLQSELLKNQHGNRSERRRLRKRKEMHAFLRKNAGSLGESRAEYGNIPISDEMLEKNIFERFIKGQCSDTEFEGAINAWLTDPAEFSKIVYDYYDHPNLIDKFFKDSIDQIEEVIHQINSYTEYERLRNAESREMRRSLVEGGFSRSKAKSLTPNFPKLNFPPDHLQKKLTPLLGKGRVGHFHHYLMRVASSGYTFKRSDVMDLMQLCYAYDCDLFRCDKSMADTFKGFLPFKGKLVSKFEELPRRIGELLQK